MFYLIRLDCERPDGPSYPELRETWRRTVAAMRGTGGPGTIQSFKVVGRRTVFALIECDDTDALDDALAELSIVEDLGGAVELEVMPLRTYDGPEATAAPPEEPTEREATTVLAEDALVTDEIRSHYEKPAGPEEQSPEEPAPPEAEPEGLIPKEIDDSEAGEPPGQDIGTEEESGRAPEREQPEGLVAGLIENFDGLDEAPTEPASPAWLEKDPGASQDFEAAPEQPEGSVPGMIRNLDSPGRLPDAPHEDPVSAKPKAPLSSPRVLLRYAGKLSGEVHEINQAGATMGRSFDNSIQLDDGMLSRRHAMIEFRDGDFWLSDFGSSNGTFVNDIRLNAPHKLKSGDVIELGSTRLDVTLEEPAR